MSSTLHTSIIVSSRDWVKKNSTKVSTWRASTPLEFHLLESLLIRRKFQLHVSFSSTKFLIPQEFHLLESFNSWSFNTNVYLSNPVTVQTINFAQTAVDIHKTHYPF